MLGDDDITQVLDEVTIPANYDYTYLYIVVGVIVALMVFDNKKESQHSKKRKKLVSESLK